MMDLPARLARNVMSKICDPQTCEVLWHPTFEADIAAAIREALEEADSRLVQTEAVVRAAELARDASVKALYATSLEEAKAWIDEPVRGRLNAALAALRALEEAK